MSIDIQVLGASDPEVLAELISATVYGEEVTDPLDSVTRAGEAVHAERLRAEKERRPWADLPTVQYAKLDDDTDWTDV
jgi:hypothetical protein